MPGQLSREEKEKRARELIAVGNESAFAWSQRWIDQEADVLVEESSQGCLTGYTPEYLAVSWPDDGTTPKGSVVRVRLLANQNPHEMTASVVQKYCQQ